MDKERVITDENFLADISSGNEVAVSESAIQIFSNENLGSIRTILKDGEPLFCLSDICKILDFRDGHNLKKSIDSEFDKGGVFNMYPLESNSGIQNYTFIGESELYFSLMRSRSDKAKPFRMWVTKEVLPSIRKLNVPIADKEKFLPQVQEQSVVAQQTFENMQVDTILKGDAVFFKLTDIEKVLGLSAGASRQWIKDGWFDSDEIDSVRNSHGGTPSNFVAESGLYRILNRTNSPKAKPFERWVTKEVLPSIRKNGGYIVGQENLTDEQLLAKALLVANNVIQNKDKVIKAQQKTIADQKEVISAYQITDKTRRNKQELATLLNRKIRELAERQFGRRYNEAYIAVYSEFAKQHCFRHKIDMRFLKTNIDYLGECLKMVLEKLN